MHKEKAGKIDDETRRTTTYRSHLGDLQYWHSMSPTGATSAKEIKGEIVEQASKWYDDAHADFAKGNHNRAGQSLGHILHMVQDSWSPAHVERDKKGNIVGFQDYSKQDPDKHTKAETPEGVDEESWESVQKKVPGAIDAKDISEKLIKAFLRQDKGGFMDLIDKNYSIDDILTYKGSTKTELAKPPDGKDAATPAQLPENMGDFPIVRRGVPYA